MTTLSIIKPISGGYAIDGIVAVATNNVYDFLQRVNKKYYANKLTFESN